MKKNWSKNLLYFQIIKTGNQNDPSLSSLSSLSSMSQIPQISQSNEGGITFQNGLGGSFTIEPAYDRKCKDENTVDIEVCAKFSIGDENQGDYLILA